MSRRLAGIGLDLDARGGSENGDSILRVGIHSNTGRACGFTIRKANMADYGTCYFQKPAVGVRQHLEAEHPVDSVTLLRRDGVQGRRD